ncbi:acetylajmalan esterase-like [Heracleum sosnowskyi]|uniref:Acetylajmalan esterase-like n=1 Tax=Heracleum sosnowskyi TaxID=360622 RepID=A0AAD8MX98_9APIA|nr:acetylajmalan esterase-like [Heracleum sosnowskyi]
MNDPSLILFRNCKYDKIFQFGDSLSDTGNIVIQDANGPSGRPPYGFSYFKQPTGRCSNGLLMIDYIAMAVGLPFLSPYLKKGADFVHGVNFAVASSTAMSIKDLAQRNITVNRQTVNTSLNVQVDWMADYLKSYCKPGPDCAQKLNYSLFMMGETGGNDMNAAVSGNKTVKEIKSLVPAIVETIMQATRRIIKFGARNIVIPGNLPIGCMPMNLATSGSNNSTIFDKNHCIKKLNRLANFYNDHLKGEIVRLKKENPKLIIVYGDLFNAVEWLLPRAPYLGFQQKELLKACCGQGGDYNFGGFGKFCGVPGVPACKNPNAHLSWDGIHPTQEANNFDCDLQNSASRQLLITCCLFGMDNLRSSLAKGGFFFPAQLKLNL